MGTAIDNPPATSISWFGARKLARKLGQELAQVRTERDQAREKLERFATMGGQLVAEVKELREERDRLRTQIEKLGALSVIELEARRAQLEKETTEQAKRLAQERFDISATWDTLKKQIDEARSTIVETREAALLQEAGVYEYRHPLSDAVSYQNALASVQYSIKEMVKKDGGAVLAATDWTVNGSASEGRAMVRNFSKLMLRAFNAEADNLVRALKPYKLRAALDRLSKVADTIQRLGRTMNIQISPAYYATRVRELELTADFLQKQAEEKEIERLERERLREERKAQEEIAREKARLEKERLHYVNALAALNDKGDAAGAARLQEQLADVARAIETMDYRAANIRAGYVYVISNIGSFGEKMVKIGMTRRLDPMERIRELSDASVPFNFDVHAIFFSKDAVGIEAAMHERLADARVNIINRRREFFDISPSEVKTHLSDLAGELLQFDEIPEALEYRQSMRVRAQNGSGISTG